MRTNRCLRSSALWVRDAVATTCALILLAGCGNWNHGEQTGAIAVRLGESQSVELLLNVCSSSSVDQVVLFGPHTGPRTKPDIPIGVWQASTPIHRDTVLNLDRPGPLWETRRDPGPLAPQTTYVAEAGYTQDDYQGLSGASFAQSQLKALRPGEVRVYSRAMQQARFERANWCREY